MLCKEAASPSSGVSSGRGVVLGVEFARGLALDHVAEHDAAGLVAVLRCRGTTVGYRLARTERTTVCNSAKQFELQPQQQHGSRSGQALAASAFQGRANSFRTDDAGVVEPRIVWTIRAMHSQ
jgi:hypothetical protein